MERCHWIRTARQNPTTTMGFDAGESDAFLLGLDYAYGLAVHIQQIVGEAVAEQRESANGDAARGVDVGSEGVADVPACRRQQHIDISPRLLFWLRRQDIPFLLSAESSHIQMDVLPIRFLSLYRINENQPGVAGLIGSATRRAVR